MYALEFKVQTLSVIEVNHCSLAENNDLLPSVSVIDRLVTSASHPGNRVVNISFLYGDLLCLTRGGESSRMPHLMASAIGSCRISQAL